MLSEYVGGGHFLNSDVNHDLKYSTKHSYYLIAK